MGRFGGLLPPTAVYRQGAIDGGAGRLRLPGFVNFVGEVTVFFGAWKVFPLVTVCAVWGALIIGAVYMLRAMRNVLHGPLATDRAYATNLTDANAWRKLPYALLLASLLVFGFFPRLLTEKITPDAAKVVSSFKLQVSSVQSPTAAQLETESLRLKPASTGDPQPAIHD